MSKFLHWENKILTGFSNSNILFYNYPPPEIGFFLFLSCCDLLRENDITSVLDHTFCVEHNAFGKFSQHELKPNGRNIPVTEENKKEYVR